jgi:formylglycine-generating enzyme required for sulfatase activity
MFGWQDGFAAPVGSFPAGHTPTGLQDMAGNVSEWVSDLITPTDGMTNRVHGVRGGAWSTVESAAVCERGAVGGTLGPRVVRRPVVR